LSTLGKAEDPLLSAVVNGRLTGLNQLSFPQRTGFRVLGEKAVAFHRRKMTEADRQRWVSACATPSSRHAFCPDIDPVLGSDANEDSGDRDAFGKIKGKSRASKAEVDRAWAAVLAGDFERLQKASESAASQAIRRVTHFDQMRKIQAALLARKPCDGVPISTLLALKSEEFLPEAEARAAVVQLHEQGASCSTAPEWAARSMYRLSLILISEGKWARAEKWLENLTQDRRSDYFSRSLYWRARAAKVRGDQLAFEQAKARLTREFPIHFHSLLLSGKKAFNAAQNLHLPEPVVSFESRTLGARWNDRVRAVETLQEQGANDCTRELFVTLESMMDQAEPEARLYLAVLQNRNFNAIGTFRTLSSLMRDHPSVLSRATLSLFFPLTKENRHLLYTYTGQGIDPYLVAALIRQESGFISSARSPAGALGLMQLMPATAGRMERVSRRDLLDGRTNVRLGVRYFRQLVERFSGKVDLALAAYNAGPERVEDWKRRYQVEDPVLFVDLIPFKETREYVSLISRNYYWYLQIYARHIFDDRVEAAKQLSKGTALARAPASFDRNLPLEFSLFSAN
jgi:soluble lytic murein transglycosylase